LHHIVKGFAAVCVAPRDVTDQRQMHLDEFITKASTLIFTMFRIVKSCEERIFDVATIRLVRRVGFLVHRNVSGAQ